MEYIAISGESHFNEMTSRNNDDKNEETNSTLDLSMRSHYSKEDLSEVLDFNSSCVFRDGFSGHCAFDDRCTSKGGIVRQSKVCGETNGKICCSCELAFFFVVISICPSYINYMGNYIR